METTKTSKPRDKKQVNFRLTKKTKVQADHFLRNNQLGIKTYAGLMAHALEYFLDDNSFVPSILRRLDRQKTEIQNLSRYMEVNSEVLLRFIRVFFYFNSHILLSEDESSAKWIHADKDYARFMKEIYLSLDKRTFISPGSLTGDLVSHIPAPEDFSENKEDISGAATLEPSVPQAKHSAALMSHIAKPKDGDSEPKPLKDPLRKNK
jgi:hypothetical protein